MKWLTVRGVRKGFPPQTPLVLEHIDLTLQQGQIGVLLGPSGSGKSTLLNLIAGLEPVDGGDIDIAGQPFSSMSTTRQTAFRRRHIGVIYQQFNLLPSLTVLENLQLPLELNRLPRHPERLDLLLQRLDIAELGERFPHTLSGGQQQRVAIARALIHQPALILADEPTGNLDNRSAGRVIDLLFEQVRDARQTLLLVTHNPDFATAADSIWQLHNGQLAQDSPQAGQRHHSQPEHDHAGD